MIVTFSKCVSGRFWKPKPLFWLIGLIPKWKPKLDDIFGRYRTWYQNQISKIKSCNKYWNYLALVWGIFSIIKGPLKPKELAPIKFGHSEKDTKFEKIFHLKFCVLLRMSKLYQYRNLTLVSVPNTKTWFRSYTIIIILTKIS